MKIPAFHEKLDDLNVDTDSGFFESLGFYKVGVFEGAGIEGEMTRRCKEKTGKSMTRVHQYFYFWAHPAGAVVTGSYFSHYASNGSLTPKQLSSLSIFGFEECSLKEPYDVFNFKSHGLSDGTRIKVFNGSHSGPPGSPSAAFALAWSSIASAHKSNTLVPLRDWRLLANNLEFPQIATSLVSAFEKLWDLSFDWHNHNFKSKKTDIPSEISHLSSRAVKKLYPLIKERINEITSEYTLEDLGFVKKILDVSIKRKANFFSLNKDQKINAELYSLMASKRLQYLFSLALDVPDRLLPSQKKVCSAWIRNLCSPSKSSQSRWKSLPINIDGVKGVASFDLLLECERNAGSWEKLIDQLNSVSDDDLCSWVRGEKSSLPLAMGIAKAILRVPNRGFSKEENDRLMSNAFLALDIIVDRLGKDALILETPEQNVFGWGLGFDFNLPVDEDLVELNERRLSSFLSWMETREIPIPEKVRWSSQDNPGVTGLEFGFDEYEKFVDQWNSHAVVLRREAVEHHWRLLEPLFLRLRRKELQCISGQTEVEERAPSSRFRI